MHACTSCHRIPVTSTVCGDVIEQNGVLANRPWTFSHAHLLFVMLLQLHLCLYYRPTFLNIHDKCFNLEERKSGYIYRGLMVSLIGGMWSYIYIIELDKNKEQGHSNVSLHGTKRDADHTHSISFLIILLQFIYFYLSKILLLLE